MTNKEISDELKKVTQRMVVRFSNTYNNTQEVTNIENLAGNQILCDILIFETEEPPVISVAPGHFGACVWKMRGVGNYKPLAFFSGIMNGNNFFLKEDDGRYNWELTNVLKKINQQAPRTYSDSSQYFTQEQIAELYNSLQSVGTHPGTPQHIYKVWNELAFTEHEDINIFSEFFFGPPYEFCANPSLELESNPLRYSVFDNIMTGYNGIGWSGPLPLNVTEATNNFISTRFNYGIIRTEDLARAFATYKINNAGVLNQDKAWRQYCTNNQTNWLGTQLKDVPDATVLLNVFGFDGFQITQNHFDSFAPSPELLNHRPFLGVLTGTNLILLNDYEDLDSNEDEAVKVQESIKNDDDIYIPDNSIIQKTEDDGTPTIIHNPNKDETDDSDKNSPTQKPDDKDESTFPEEVNKTTTDDVYELTYQNVHSFINYFWGNSIQLDEGLFNVIVGTYGDLASCVLGITFIPIDLELPTQPKTVKLGRLDTSLNFPAVQDTVKSVDVISNYHIAYRSEIDGKGVQPTFMDYSPFTEIDLYLPYLGIVKLDTNMYIGHDLTVKLSVEITSGNATYILMSDGTITDTHTFQLGMNLPFTLSDSSSLTASKIQNAVNTGLSIGTAVKEPTLAVQAMVGGATQTVNAPAMTHIGNCTGGSNLENQQQPIIYIKRPVYVRPKEYGKEVGFPCNKSLKLGTLSGFTVCQNAKIKSFSKAITSTEYDQLITLLEGGIIL